MKPSSFLLAALTIIICGCKTTNPGSHSAMLMDSSYPNDPNVILVHKNHPVRIMESMKHFEDNPNITQADIDAGKRIENKYVRYVNQGDRIRMSEESPANAK